MIYILDSKGSFKGLRKERQLKRVEPKAPVSILLKKTVERMNGLKGEKGEGGFSKEEKNNLSIKGGYSERTR